MSPHEKLEDEIAETKACKIQMLVLTPKPQQAVSSHGTLFVMKSTRFKHSRTRRSSILDSLRLGYIFCPGSLR